MEKRNDFARRGLCLFLMMLCALGLPMGSAFAAVDEFGMQLPDVVESSDHLEPVLGEVYKPQYAIRIDIGAQRVTIYEQDENGSYVVPIKVMKCSTGLDETPTPTGVFTTSQAGEWYYFKEFDVWAQYATRIYGGIIIHSVLYTQQDVKTLQTGSVSKLGKKASHGCIRLAVADAKWIYENAGNGVTCQVVDNDVYRPANNKIGGPAAGEMTAAPAEGTTKAPKAETDEAKKVAIEAKATPKPTAKATPKPTATPKGESARTRR